jgi:cysteine synthase
MFNFDLSRLQEPGIRILLVEEEEEKEGGREGGVGGVVVEREGRRKAGGREGGKRSSNYQAASVDGRVGVTEKEAVGMAFYVRREEGGRKGGRKGGVIWCVQPETCF